MLIHGPKFALVKINKMNQNMWYSCYMCKSDINLSNIFNRIDKVFYNQGEF